MSKISSALRPFLMLIKHRLTLMVTFSTLVGYVILEDKNDASLFFLVLGVYLLAGGAAALNEYQEHVYDGLMVRTKKRPIPAGDMSASQGLYISVFLIAVGSLMLLYNGVVPALLGLLNVLFYNGAYTPMKRRSSYAVLPGAIVGAIPPMIGWASGGGSLMHPHILYLAAFMFLWQMPHFWLLIIKFGKEYEKAGFSSMSSQMNEAHIKRLIFYWTGLTSLFLVFFPFLTNVITWQLIPFLVILNIVFIGFFYQLLFKKESANQIRNAFIAINSYMLLMLIFMMVNTLFV